MSNILLLELIRVQNQYRGILETAKLKLSTSLPIEVLNEITTFWYRNKNIVKCALYWLSYRPFETYLFTAAVNLDIDEKDHYPFVLMGRMHILDDPVFKFATTAPAMSELSQHTSEYHKGIALEAIEANIKILDCFQGVIFVLPVSCMFDDLEVVNMMAEKSLLGFFNEEVSSVEDILRKCESFGDVKKLLRPNMDKQIILNGFEDFKINLDDRICKQREYQRKHGYPDNGNEASNFVFALYSHILRASSIIEVCMKYCITPFLRYDVVYHYFSSILGSVSVVSDCSEMKMLLSKSQVAFSVGKVIDRDLLDKIGFDAYREFCMEYGFERRLASKLQKLDGCSKKTGLISTVHSTLTDFYNFCGLS